MDKSQQQQKKSRVWESFTGEASIVPHVWGQDALFSRHQCMAVAWSRYCTPGKFTWALVSRVFIGTLLHRHDWLTDWWLIGRMWGHSVFRGTVGPKAPRIVFLMRPAPTLRLSDVASLILKSAVASPYPNLRYSYDKVPPRSWGQRPDLSLGWSQIL